MFDIFDAVSGAFRFGKNAINNRKLKDTMHAVESFLKLLDKSLQQTNKYTFNTLDDGTVEAITSINTIIGPRQMSIYFTPDRIYPYLHLANNIDMEKDPSNLLWSINLVNIDYANLAIAVITSEDGNIFNCGLRGPIYFANINDWSYNSIKNVTEEVMLPLNSVFNFISSLNKDIGSTSLQDLLAIL